nr:hypothetical protein [Tanacetum cinerariifolium]
MDVVTDIHRAQRLKDLVGDDKLRYDSDIKAVNILLPGLPLYAFLKHNERDAKEVQEKRQRFPEPLALLANTYNPPPSYNIVQQPPPFQPDTRLAIPTFLPTDDPIASLNKATIQSHSYAGNAGNNQALGAWVINTGGNTGANQPRVIRCYNCNGEGHMAKQCTTKKRVKDSKWFKDKMLLTHAQKAGVVLDEEKQDVLANSLEETDDYCDDEAIANAIFMANLSPIGSLNDDTVVPRYDFDTLFKVPHYDTYHDSDMLNSNIQELGYIENIISNNESYDELIGVIRCYNCNGEGHMAKQCITKKRVKDSKWFKDKMLLTHAQKAGVVLDKEKQDVLANSLEEIDDCGISSYNLS